MTFKLHALTACLALSAVLAAPAAMAKNGGDAQLQGEALVQLTSTEAMGPLLQKYPLTLLSQFGARPIYRLKLIGNGSGSGNNPKLDTVLGQLALETTVLAAEPNFVHQSPEARKNVVWAIGSPQDYATQWAPQAINLPAAQALSTGAGVRVAVLDSGVDRSHPLLAGRLLPGWDFVDNDADPAEGGSTADAGYGHGTHVAGLVAMVAPGARIVPLRVLDSSGRGNVWVLAEALLRAVDPDGNPATDDGAQVINISLGTLERTRILRAVLQLSACALPVPVPGAGDDDYADAGYSGDKDRCRTRPGAVIVAAGGNGGSGSEQQYPAAENEYGLLPVAASASNGKVASFSNYGSWLNLAAPGDRITSAFPGGGYATWGGTSMAAPMTAGTAALLRARFPTMPAKDLARRIQDNGSTLCGARQTQLDALAALNGVRPAQKSCR